MVFKRGKIVWVQYRGHKLAHARLLVSCINKAKNRWVVITPDHDKYAEDLDPAQNDEIRLVLLPKANGEPSGVRTSELYGFAEIAPHDLIEMMKEADEVAVELMAGELGEEGDAEEAENVNTIVPADAGEAGAAKKIKAKPKETPPPLPPPASPPKKVGKGVGGSTGKKTGSCSSRGG